MKNRGSIDAAVGAGGGIRTRTLLRGGDFHTTIAFATCNAVNPVCGLDDAFSLHRKQWLGGSRLVSTLCEL